MSKLHVKTGDNVIILSGKDKGKQGKILETSPKEGKILIENLNLVTKHVKPRQMGQKGSVVKAEAPLYACKVMAICPHCGKPTKPGHKIIDGQKARVCKKADCGKAY
jgi:large subunit ribosomal protein L24